MQLKMGRNVIKFLRMIKSLRWIGISEAVIGVVLIQSNYGQYLESWWAGGLILLNGIMGVVCGKKSVSECLVNGHRGCSVVSCVCSIFLAVHSIIDLNDSIYNLPVLDAMKPFMLVAILSIAAFCLSVASFVFCGKTIQAAGLPFCCGRKCKTVELVKKIDIKKAEEKAASEENRRSEPKSGDLELQELLSKSQEAENQSVTPPPSKKENTSDKPLSTTATMSHIDESDKTRLPSKTHEETKETGNTKHPESSQTLTTEGQKSSKGEEKRHSSTGQSEKVQKHIPAQTAGPLSESPNPQSGLLNLSTTSRQ